MTDTTTEPVAHPATTQPPPEPASPPREQTQAPTAERELTHTPGGIPVLPLALSGTNGAVGAVSTVALAGGGPVALAVAAGGAAVLGTAAAVRARRRTTAQRNSASGSGRREDAGRSRRTSSPSPSRSTGGASGGGRGRGSGTKSRTGRGKGMSALRSGRGGTDRQGGRHASRSAVPRSAGARSGAGRIGQVRALRNNSRTQAPTRSAARRQTAAARRQVADARRNARVTARAAKAGQAAGSRGALRRAAGWAAGKATAGSRALVNKARAARDRSTAAQVDAKRGQVRKAPARRKARRGLLKSAARFQGRRLLAALAGGAAGVLGCLTTPLGKKLGWSWLMHPGRRLYRRLLLAAAEKRAARDEQIRATRAAEEAAADGDPDVIGDRVERPAHLVPAAPTAAQEVIHVSGFKFEEAAAEMESAARQYEPDGNMEVLAMIDNLPTALLSIANTFRILAERSDEEFAFEKDVAAGFDDIHRTLLNAVDDSETLVPLFRNVHAQDIARHEDPRNGTEAEKGWNV
ncbi:hypothetical protein [Streptomyces sp. NBC_01373]|uniref:hypothetical protein n=1 Tax=Streptomyces sp. NBC_01373 TaxID=2903843 RepID=UPI002251FDFB|nr:hypothetical protein [Streptomyces sp. NBC_01373]MCX4698671.1 hypothetical protein [Streptomyces sp. NBC_01373]